MKIEVVIQGDPDVQPFTKTFQYEKTDEDIFVESAQLIKKRLSNNVRLNINDTLELFVTCIVSSLNERKTCSEIKKNIPDLLSPNQVMIGVPETLRKLTFKITTNHIDSQTISISTPITIKPYFLHEQRQSA
jgi:urease gamma subunit